MNANIHFNVNLHFSNLKLTSKVLSRHFHFFFHKIKSHKWKAFNPTQYKHWRATTKGYKGFLMTITNAYTFSPTEFSKLLLIFCGAVHCPAVLSQSQTERGSLDQWFAGPAQPSRALHPWNNANMQNPKQSDLASFIN